MSPDWIRHRIWIEMLAGGIVCLSCSGCLRPVVEPQKPDSPITKVTRAAVVDYAHRVADSFDEAARQLDAGTLKNAADANSHLKSANVTARQEAFQPVNKLLNDELGGDRWDAKKAKDLFKKIAQGLRSFP